MLGQIHADDLDLVLARKPRHIGLQGLFRASQRHVEDLSPAQIAEGRGEAVLPGKVVLVDPQDPGTGVVHALPDLDLQQLLVPALYRGRSQALSLRQRPLRDAAVMRLEDLLSEGLRRSPIAANPWKALVEVPAAALAVVFMALEVKSRR